jgi:hypothetical protein
MRAASARCAAMPALPSRAAVPYRIVSVITVASGLSTALTASAMASRLTSARSITNSVTDGSGQSLAEMMTALIRLAAARMNPASDAVLQGKAVTVGERLTTGSPTASGNQRPNSPRQTEQHHPDNAWLLKRQLLRETPAMMTVSLPEPGSAFPLDLSRSHHW